MGVLLKHGGKYYEIPDDVLKRSVIPKAEFEQKVRELEVELTTKGTDGIGQYDLLDLSDIDEE
jgi:hypothetical protein